MLRRALEVRLKVAVEMQWGSIGEGLDGREGRAGEAGGGPSRSRATLPDCNRESLRAARIDNGHGQLLTRTGLDWTEKYPSAVAALSSLMVKTSYIDGELCGVDEAGLPTFAPTSTRMINVPPQTLFPWCRLRRSSARQLRAERCVAKLRVEEYLCKTGIRRLPRWRLRHRRSRQDPKY